MDPSISSTSRLLTERRPHQAERPSTIFRSSALVSRTAAVGGIVANAESITSMSSVLVTNSVEGGILSRRRQTELTRPIDEQISTMVSSVRKKLSSIDQAIDELAAECNKVCKALTALFEKLAAEPLTSDYAIFESQVRRYELMINVSNLQIDSVRKCNEAVIKFNESGLKNVSLATVDVIDTIFRVRKEEVALLSTQLDLIQKVEEHQFQIFASAHKSRLEEEIKLFNQMKELAEFESNERELEAGRDLRVRAQAHQEDVDIRRLSLDERTDLRRLDLEERKIEQAHEIEGRRLSLEERKNKFEHDIKKHEEDSRASLERARIDADERARIAEADAQARVGVAQAAASASKCSIM